MDRVTIEYTAPARNKTHLECLLEQTVSGMREVILKMDGNSWMVHRADFVDIMQTPNCGFGDTLTEALYALAMAEKDMSKPAVDDGDWCCRNGRFAISLKNENGTSRAHFIEIDSANIGSVKLGTMYCKTEGEALDNLTSIARRTLLNAELLAFCALMEQMIQLRLEQNKS